MFLVLDLSWKRYLPWSERMFLGDLVAHGIWSVICLCLILYLDHLGTTFLSLRYEITSYILSPSPGVKWSCSVSVLVCYFLALILRTFFGAPLSRRRIFIVMIRLDCLRVLDGNLEDYILGILNDMKRPIHHAWPLVTTKSCWVLWVWVLLKSTGILSHVGLAIKARCFIRQWSLGSEAGL